MEKKISEFGKGLTYCLGLFLAHEERFGEFLKCNQEIEEKMKEKFPDYNPEKRAAELWFNASSDHLYELKIPKILPQNIKRRLRLLRSKCLSWGHGFGLDKSPYGVADEEKFRWAIDEAKELLMLIDKFYLVEVIEAQWK